LVVGFRELTNNFKISKLIKTGQREWSPLFCCAVMMNRFLGQFLLAHRFPQLIDKMGYPGMAVDSKGRVHVAHTYALDGPREMAP